MVQHVAYDGRQGTVAITFRSLDNSNSSGNGTKIDMWDCNGTAAQNWTIQGDGTIRIHGSCMDITGAGTANGTLIELWTCNGGAN